MTERQKLALETKHKIIGAARELIAERGISDISVQDITKKAGVAKGSFYTYYDKKEDILSEIAYQNFDALKEKYLKEREGDFVYKYLTEYMEAIYEGGLALCKSWTANELLGKNGGICKFEMDCSNLSEILAAAGVREKERVSADILFYLYGAMTAWCMTDGAYDLMQNFKKNYGTIEKMMEES